jgi:hypothetical protein
VAFTEDAQVNFCVLMNFVDKVAVRILRSNHYVPFGILLSSTFHKASGEFSLMSMHIIDTELHFNGDNNGLDENVNASDDISR